MALSNALNVTISGAPAWFASATKQRWGTLSNNTPQSVAPSATDIQQVIDAWGGGSFDQARRRYTIFGGGHNDYGGNEMYEIDLSVSTPVWVRLTNPSSTTGGDATRNGVGDYADGRMRSTHTSTRGVYAKDRIWFPGLWGMASGGGSTEGTTAIWSFNRGALSAPFPTSTNPYTFHGKGKASVPGNPDYSFEGGAALYEPVGDDLWSVPQYGVSASGGFRVNISNVNAPVVTEYTSWNFPVNPFGNAWGVVVSEDATHRWLILGSTSEQRLWVLDCNNPLGNWRQVNTTGTGMWTGGSAAVYDPANRKILVYHQSLGTVIRTITVPTNPYTAAASAFVWGTLSAVGGGVTPPGTVNGDYQGPYYRLQLAQNMGNGEKCIFVIHNNLGPMHFYPLPTSY